MNKKAAFLRFAVVAVVVVSLASLASAAVLNSDTPGAGTPKTIALTATLSESLSVNLSVNTASFTLTAGSATNHAAAGVTATTTWVLNPSRTAVKVYAWFGTAASALNDGSGDNIPSSAFSISDNGGGYTALTSSAANAAGFGPASAGLLLSNTAISSSNENSSATDAMLFNIDLSSLTQLPAGTYTGTLNIQAQATP